mgnify:CR=1 FL=1
MARPLRVDLENGWYHVTARGDHGRALFCEERDHARFTGLLEEMRDRFRVGVMAYVCMTNHYHVIVRTPEANLSRAIQWLNISYSVWFNRRHGENGHVFQGRFKAVVVEDGVWGLELSDYVHLNPVRIRVLGQGQSVRAAERAGLSAPPTVEEVKRRLNRLRTYRWSSYRAYAGYGGKPAWLDSETLLARAGGTARYRQGVENRIRQGVEESPWERVKWGVALGTEEFAQRIQARLKAGRETPAKQSLRMRRSFEEVVVAVERLSGEPWVSFAERHGDKRRDLTLWVARGCTGLTLAELGQKAGGMDYAAVAMAVRRLPAACQRDKALAALRTKVIEMCQM